MVSRLRAIVKWNANDEPRLARPRLDAHVATVVLRNSVDSAEPDPRPLADRFRREKWLENPALNLGRNTRAAVDYFDSYTPAVTRRANHELALAIHCISRVRNQIRPDLVQLAPANADLRQRPVVITNNVDAFLKAMTQHNERVFDAVMNVDLLLRHLVHVGILFDSTDQLGHSRGAT